MTAEGDGSSQGHSLSRRRVMKVAAASTAGLTVASGRAAANSPFQINFCGCSQVCVDFDGANSTQSFTVLVAREVDDEDGWEFSVVQRDGDFCYEVDDGKIIAGTPTNEATPWSNHACYVCNPTPCATKALAAWEAKARTKGKAGSQCRSREFGRGQEYGGDDGVVCTNRDPFDVVRGGCGEPGRNPGPPSGGGPPEDAGPK